MSSALDFGGRRGLVLALLGVGFAVRLLGLSWGLPDQLYPGEPPFHPDEAVPYVQAGNLYTEPTGTTFIWGGGLYMRLTWLARPRGHPGSSAGSAPRSRWC